MVKCYGQCNRLRPERIIGTQAVGALVRDV